MSNKVTIDAWLVRDKHVYVDAGTGLYLGKEKPERYMESGTWCNMEECYPINQEFFPTITWESEPKKVKVTIELEE